MILCFQEELKILRLRYSLLVEEELETRENELNRTLEHKKTLKVWLLHYFNSTLTHFSIIWK